MNQAASAKVHSSGRAFEQFKEAINDEDTLHNCAASLACSSFTCRLGKAWGAVEHDSCHDEHLYASVLRATGGLVLPMRGSSAARDRRKTTKVNARLPREEQPVYTFKRTAYSKC